MYLAEIVFAFMIHCRVRVRIRVVEQREAKLRRKVTVLCLDFEVEKTVIS